MRVILGLVAAAGAFAFSFVMVWLAGLMFTNAYASHRAEMGWIAAAVVIALGVSAWTFRSIAGLVRSAGMASSVATGAITVGSAGFVLGFFGPMLLSDGNQGPLLGLLITGPLGALAGGVWGAAAWSRRRRAGDSAGGE